MTLKDCADSSPGEDTVHYVMLSHLPNAQLLNLLKFFNFLWVTNTFPDEWRCAIVLPFLKPGKPSALLSSYRPISITSCVCKLFEKMVLFRLTSYLEKLHFIKPYQSGFRKMHSTLDPLVRFESAIQNAFIRQEYLVAVFIDLEKAYDLIWKHLVLKILAKLGLKGHLPKYI